MLQLVPPNVWLHFTTGIVGALIMVYTFLQRLLKERYLVSEVLMATIVGTLLGPAVGKIFYPRDWFENEDTFFQFIQEVMRLVLAIQLASAATGLPFMYVEVEWKSLAMMLGPIAVITWGVSFAITWLLLGDLGVYRCLAIAACLTPTDPVLASTVIQGRFAALHLPPGLRHLLSAESAANDGSALPFVMLPLMLLEASSPAKGLAQWLYEAWGYQVLLAILVGILFGLCARGIKWISTKHSLQDEPSFLAHIIGLAFGIQGFVRAIGSSGVLAVFAGSVAFCSRDPTGEEGSYDAIYGLEIIITVSFFTLFGSFLPFHAWAQLGLGRLLLYSLAVILLRRLPVVLAFCRFIPELQRESGGSRSMLIQAGFAGFFGPIGVGALFYTTFVQEEIGDERAFQVVSFVVLCSIVLHGMSAAPLSRLLARGLADAKQLDTRVLAPYGERDAVLDNLYLEAVEGDVE